MGGDFDERFIKRLLSYVGEEIKRSKRSRDQELYQGVGNRKIYSYFGEALKGGRC